TDDAAALQLFMENPLKESLDANFSPSYRRLSGALSALSLRLGPDERSAAAREGVDRLCNSTDSLQQEDLAGALAELTPQLGPEDADAAARRVADAIARTADPSALPALESALLALGPHIRSGEALTAIRQGLEVWPPDSKPDDLRRRV